MFFWKENFCFLRPSVFLFHQVLCFPLCTEYNTIEIFCLSFSPTDNLMAQIPHPYLWPRRAKMFRKWKTQCSQKLECQKLLTSHFIKASHSTVFKPVITTNLIIFISGLNSQAGYPTDYCQDLRFKWIQFQGSVLGLVSFLQFWYLRLKLLKLSISWLLPEFSIVYTL